MAPNGRVSRLVTKMAPVSIFQVRLRSLKPGEVGGPINKHPWDLAIDLLKISNEIVFRSPATNQRSNG